MIKYNKITQVCVRDRWLREPTTLMVAIVKARIKVMYNASQFEHNKTPCRELL